MENKTLGQIAFETYASSREWKAYDGTEIPQWDNTHIGVQEAWSEAASAVRSICVHVPKKPKRKKKVGRTERLSLIAGIDDEYINDFTTLHVQMSKPLFLALKKISDSETRGVKEQIVWILECLLCRDTDAISRVSLLAAALEEQNQPD